MSILDYIKDIFQRPERYTKFIIAFFGFGLTVVLEYYPETKWAQPLAAFMTAIGVFVLPNVKVNR